MRNVVMLILSLTSSVTSRPLSCRPSIPAERLLKAQLLIALHSMRSDRLFWEMPRPQYSVSLVFGYEFAGIIRREYRSAGKLVAQRAR
jgi:hypothetical protein